MTSELHSLESPYVLVESIKSELRKATQRQLVDPAIAKMLEGRLWVLSRMLKKWIPDMIETLAAPEPTVSAGETLAAEQTILAVLTSWMNVGAIAERSRLSADTVRRVLPALTAKKIAVVRAAADRGLEYKAK